MASRTFISWICHFWAQFWLNFNFGDFRAYFGYFSLVKIDFFEIYFQSWRIKLRVLKFFRPILIIKRHQKNTQAKLFEKFASRQHALVRISMLCLLLHCADSVHIYIVPPHHQELDDFPPKITTCHLPIALLMNKTKTKTKTSISLCVISTKSILLWF